MPINIYSLDPPVIAKAVGIIDSLVDDPKGLPNGKNKRTKLDEADAQRFKSALIEAVGHAAVWASKGALPNRAQERGRPPDNAVFIFIDDIVRACEAAGLKPGLRYVSGSESLPVKTYKELAPLLWPGAATSPRRVFERWQRYSETLARA
jgi:hypothetical protein